MDATPGELANAWARRSAEIAGQQQPNGRQGADHGQLEERSTHDPLGIVLRAVVGRLAWFVVLEVDSGASGRAGPCAVGRAGDSGGRRIVSLVPITLVPWTSPRSPMSGSCSR